MRHRIVLAALAAMAAACDPRIPSGGVGRGAGGDPGLFIHIEPPAPLTGAPRALRIHAVIPGEVLDLQRIYLFRDEIGPGQLRALSQGEMSKALGSRLVQARVFREGGEAVLAPEAALDPKEIYTLVIAELPEAVALQVPADAAPPLARIWPPEGESGGVGFAAWCGDTSLPRVDVEVALAPDGARGRMRQGVSEGAGARCLRFEAEGEATKGGLPPPAVAQIALDPRPIVFDARPPPLIALACEEGEVPFGPGCARVADDRIFGRSPETPLLWAVTGAGTDAVFTTRAGDPFVITGLPPASAISLSTTVIDAGGASRSTLFAALTAPPQPHLVINEVLANPLGSEPIQEWVEIVNDGQAPAVIEGVVLADGAGITLLPAATLAPGEFALIVNESFVEEDGLDTPPAPGTRILRVPHLGKSGLANAGEPLSLLDPEGQVLSRFPPAPKPKAGRSVARRAPSAVDGVAASFDLAAPSPGRANTW